MIVLKATNETLEMTGGAGVAITPTRKGYVYTNPGQLATSLTVAPDGTITTGDWMVMVYTGTTTVTVTPPAGWTTLQALTTAGTLKTAIYGKIRAGGDTSYVVTVDAGGTTSTLALMWGAGADIVANWMTGTNKLRASIVPATSSDNVAPSITTSIDHSLVLTVSTERTSTSEADVTRIAGATEWFFGPQIGSTQLQTTTIGYRPDIGASSLIVDASTPPNATKPATGTTLTTASFTAPANALIVAFIAYDMTTTTANNHTVADSGGLSWTLRGRKSPDVGSTNGAGTDGGVEIWSATTVTATARTVTATQSVAKDAQLSVMVFTDLGGAPTPGAIAAASSASGLASVAVTTTANNSLVWAVSSDWNQTGLGTTGPNQAIVSEYDPAGLFTAHVWKQTTATSTSGTAVTMNLTAPAAQQFNVLAFEIKAQPGSAGQSGATSDVTIVYPNTDAANGMALQIGLPPDPSTTALDYSVSYEDVTVSSFVPSSAEGKIISATTTTLLAAPGASVQRVVKLLTIANRSTVGASTILLTKNIAGTTYRMLPTLTLLAGEVVQYMDGVGWLYYAADGTRKYDLATAGGNLSVQLNSNGILSGDQDLTWDGEENALAMLGADTNIQLAGVASEPSVPSTGSVRLYAKAIVGKMQLKIKGPSGLDTPLQAVMWQNNTVLWTPSGNVGLWQGTNGVTAGTASVVAPAITNTYTMMRRSAFSNVVTTTNQTMGVRSDNMFARGNFAGMGGFMFVCRFGFESIKTGMRAFIGMCPSTTIVSADPSTSLNTLGFGFDLADSAWTFMHNDAVGTATKETISGQGILATNSTGYDAYIWCAPNSNKVYYRFDRIDTGATLVDSFVVTDLPINTTQLMAVAHMSNGTANVVLNDAVLGINRLYVETDR